jgi:excisionase family DNA binding protein
MSRAGQVDGGLGAALGGLATPRRIRGRLPSFSAAVDPRRKLARLRYFLAAKTTDRSLSITLMRESLLTAGQVASVLGVPRSWVYEQSRAGRIPTVKLGRYRRYRREAIEAWLQELETAVHVRADAR